MYPHFFHATPISVERMNHTRYFPALKSQFLSLLLSSCQSQLKLVERKLSFEQNPPRCKLAPSLSRSYTVRLIPETCGFQYEICLPLVRHRQPHRRKKITCFIKYNNPICVFWKRNCKRTSKVIFANKATIRIIFLKKKKNHFLLNAQVFFWN